MNVFKTTYDFSGSRIALTAAPLTRMPVTPIAIVPAAWQVVYAAAARAVVEQFRRDLWLGRLEPSLN